MFLFLHNSAYAKNNQTDRLEPKKKEIHLQNDLVAAYVILRTVVLPSFNCKAERNLSFNCTLPMLCNHMSSLSQICVFSLALQGNQCAKVLSNHSFQPKTALIISTKVNIAHPICKPTKKQKQIDRKKKLKRKI